MIVPMKKVSLIILGDKKTETLQKLRKLGLLHIEITEGSGEKLNELKARIALLESAIFSVGKQKDAEEKSAEPAEALAVAEEIVSLAEQKKDRQAERIALQAELDRLKNWGDIDPTAIAALAEKGVEVSLYEMPTAEYESLDACVRTLCLEKTKAAVRFLLIRSGAEGEEAVIESLLSYRIVLPQMSTAEMRQKIEDLNSCVEKIDETIVSYAGYANSMKQAIKACEKEIEFEVYATGMADESLSEEDKRAVSVAYFNGYIEAEKLGSLQQAAKEAGQSGQLRDEWQAADLCGWLWRGCLFGLCHFAHHLQAPPVQFADALLYAALCPGADHGGQ